jgi:hypothetical protein
VAFEYIVGGGVVIVVVVAVVVREAVAVRVVSGT